MDTYIDSTTNYFFISEKDHKKIKDDAKSFDKDETGGGLFGIYDEFGNPIVFKVVNPISNCNIKGKGGFTS